MWISWFPNKTWGIPQGTSHFVTCVTHTQVLVRKPKKRSEKKKGKKKKTKEKKKRFTIRKSNLTQIEQIGGREGTELMKKSNTHGNLSLHSNLYYVYIFRWLVPRFPKSTIWVFCTVTKILSTLFTILHEKKNYGLKESFCSLYWFWIIFVTLKIWKRRTQCKYTTRFDCE